MFEDICDTKRGNKRITFIEGDDEDNRIVKTLTYKELRKDARQKSFMIKHQNVARGYVANGSVNRIVVLDLHSHYEKITWFWGVIALGWVPV